MNKREFYPGQEVLDTDLNGISIDINSNIEKIARLSLEHGIFKTSELQVTSNDTRWDAVGEFDITAEDDTTISVGSGIAYDINSNPIEVLAGSVAYDIDNLTIEDSLGNVIPKSTGNSNIPLPYAVNYVYIEHILAIDTATTEGNPPADKYTIDPDLGTVRYTNHINGYAITVFDSDQLTSVSPKILLAVITAPATLEGNIVISDRIYSKVSTSLISTTLPANSGEITTAYAKDTRVTLEDHLSSVADVDSILPSNPHGLTMDAIPDLVDSLGMYAFYPEIFKSNGIINYARTVGVGPFFGTIGLLGDYEYVSLPRLIADQYLLVKSRAYNLDSDFYSEVVDAGTGHMVPELTPAGEVVKCFFANGNLDRQYLGYYMICMKTHLDDSSAVLATAVYIGTSGATDLTDLLQNPKTYLEAALVNPEDLDDYLPLCIVDFESELDIKYLADMIDPLTLEESKAIDIRKFGTLDTDLLSNEPHYKADGTKQLNLLTFNRNINFGLDVTIDGDLTLNGNLIVGNDQLLSIPRWIKFTYDYSSFQLPAPSMYAFMYDLPAGGVIHGVKIKHSESFNVTGYTFSVGLDTGGSPILDKYSAAFDVNQAPGPTVMQTTDGLWSENQEAISKIILAATVACECNVDDATTGSVDVWLLVSSAV